MSPLLYLSSLNFVSGLEIWIFRHSANLVLGWKRSNDTNPIWFSSI